MKSSFFVAFGVGTLILCATLGAAASASDGDATGACCPRTDPNLLRNPGFEKGSCQLPYYWQRDAFVYSADLFRWNRYVSHYGRRSVEVSIPEDEPNDARWIQTVSVEPDTTYRLSGWIKTEGVATAPNQLIDVGANLSILDVTINGGFTFTPGLTGDNDWTFVSVSFETGQNTTVTVAARVGMYAGVASGTAWFDDIHLREVRSCEEE